MRSADRSGPPARGPRVGLERVRVRGFRSALDVSFAPGPVCALVGAANTGKSNLLHAIRALLDPSAARFAADDLAPGRDGRILIDATLAGAGELTFMAAPPGRSHRAGAPPSPVAFLPGELRTRRVLAPLARDEHGAVAPVLAQFAGLVEAALGGEPGSAGGAAIALVDALERAVAVRLRGIVLLLEEPELFLPPQAQRYLYRLLRAFADAGNQVIYSTHSPSFLNVARLGELALVGRDSALGTAVTQPDAITPDDDFRVLTEFDAERSELFLARAALLVEGQTEKLAFPFVFGSLGRDPDREGITVVACGGKSNIPLFARACNATGIPFIAVFDRDAAQGRRPTYSTRQLNALIARVAGPGRSVMLVPDFEGAAGLSSHHHKPEQAWRWLESRPSEELPAPLVEAVRRVLELAGDR